MAVPKRLRYEVLRRDNFSCRYCGARAPLAELHVDHVIPRRHGGRDAAWNLTAACVECNLGKTDGVPDELTIREVREDESTYLKSKGLPVDPCIHCSKPVQREPEDDISFPAQCGTCNEMVCDAYDAGFKRGSAQRGEQIALV